MRLSPIESFVLNAATAADEQPCRVVRAFDPTFAATHVDSAFVDGMSAITPLRALGMLSDLKQQLPQYLSAAASAPSMDQSSVEDYSTAILAWWRTHFCSLANF